VGHTAEVGASARHFGNRPFSRMLDWLKAIGTTRMTEFL
jgi:hypothetical protein